jgi:hypothetical protein
MWAGESYGVDCGEDGVMGGVEAVMDGEGGVLGRQERWRGGCGGGGEGAMGEEEVTMVGWAGARYEEAGARERQERGTARQERWM